MTDWISNLWQWESLLWALAAIAVLRFLGWLREVAREVVHDRVALAWLQGWNARKEFEHSAAEAARTGQSNTYEWEYREASIMRDGYKRWRM